MAHCYRIGVQIDGKDEEICSIVPGNDTLRRDVEAAQRRGKNPRKPTDDESQRAIDYFTRRQRQGSTDSPSNEYHPPHF